MSKKDWKEITEETFKVIAKNSPLKRTKFSGIKRNIDFLR
jgi:epoxyqueuosine reductase